MTTFQTPTHDEQRDVRRRSLALLRELVRPVARPASAAAVLVVLAQVALVAGPALVAYGIDTAL
ncbi:MAG TPA: ABC transporter ATP-binding protein, partial [Cellulomonas sp.]|nr:ABC transporter ATP-binding protein [Cellulomonas sp.]